ncbi:hypothetical protein GCK72_006328 [Caenorhabditis remanei]|uniref:Uncharacterized protein n=1 Tax=Caenorhabditis remanei TaxID=31234 RepID=A0A6A5HH47_CAERE|nr:hypothetical protein GCK72_006328 [Caenorhabditis remanei]KAF1766371.1 hypothetical protein GCK72_006328 [Caenorhabditis remanei]
MLVCTMVIFSMAPRMTMSFWSSTKNNILWRRKETEHLDCGRVLRNDKKYIENFTGDNRISIVTNLKYLDMSCDAIQNRIIPFNFHLRPLKVGVVFARVVYKDYEFLEKQVQMSYHPQNIFCFFIDSKSDSDFKWRMRRLGRCLPNIHVMDEELPIDSAGHNMNMAHYKCMEKMVKIPNWGYFVLMQNHDVIGKTVYEISRIFEILDGANDIDIDKEFGRIEERFEWDLKTLRLFRDESIYTSSFLNSSLRISKGSVQGSLSREAVEWMVKTVNPRKYGVDEQWISTFQANEFLEMPGHFTDKCLKETGNKTDFITRWSKWSWSDEMGEKCGSKYVRHGVCIMGIEELPVIARMPNIMFNKVLIPYEKWFS